MTNEEFELEFIKMVSKYGYSLRPDEENSYWEKGKKIYINRSELPGKPDSTVMFNFYTSAGKPVLGVAYNSVLYFVAPSGNDSFTSKDYYQVVKGGPDKFKWDIFERWLKDQSETIARAKKLSKVRKEKIKMKELNKDF